MGGFHLRRKTVRSPASPIPGAEQNGPRTPCFSSPSRGPNSPLPRGAGQRRGGLLPNSSSCRGLLVPEPSIVQSQCLASLFRSRWRGLAGPAEIPGVLLFAWASPASASLPTPKFGEFCHQAGRTKRGRNLVESHTAMLIHFCFCLRALCVELSVPEHQFDGVK